MYRKSHRASFNRCSQQRIPRAGKRYAGGNCTSSVPSQPRFETPPTATPGSLEAIAVAEPRSILSTLRSRSRTSPELSDQNERGVVGGRLRVRLNQVGGVSFGQILTNAVITKQSVKTRCRVRVNIFTSRFFSTQPGKSTGMRECSLK